MSNTVSTIQYNDLYNMAAVTTGAAINRADESEELKQLAIGGGALLSLPYAFKAGKFALWDTPKFLINNRGNYASAFSDAWNNSFGKTNLYASNRNALKGNFWNTVKNSALQQEAGCLQMDLPNLKSLNNESRALASKARAINNAGGGSFIKSLKNRLDKIVNNFKIVRNNNKIVKAKIYNLYDLPKLMREAKSLKGADLAAKMKEIEIAKANADILINEAKVLGVIKHSTKIGKAASWVKTKSGYRALSNKIAKGTMSTNKAISSLAKGAKGGAGMAVISLALETPMIVEGFKRDTSTGFKQLGHSSAKVVAETVGYMAGAKIGAIAGAKIGATVGTCIGGPIGTAVGAAIGTVIGVGTGLLCSWLAGKGIRKVLGDDPVEVAKMQDAQQLAHEAENNPEKQMELAQSAYTKIEEGSVRSQEDAETALGSIQTLIDSVATTQTLADNEDDSKKDTKSSRKKTSTEKTKSDNKKQIDDKQKQTPFASLVTNNIQSNAAQSYTPIVYTAFSGNWYKSYNMTTNPFFSFGPYQTAFQFVA